VKGLATSLLVQDEATVRAALYVELNVVQCVAVRGGEVAAVAVCAGSIGNAGPAMRAVEREVLSFLARVALCVETWAIAVMCVRALMQAAATMLAAAHAALNIVARVTWPVLTVARGPAGHRTGIAVINTACGYGAS